MFFRLDKTFYSDFAKNTQQYRLPSDPTVFIYFLFVHDVEASGIRH